jgi:hypothetical protein
MHNHTQALHEANLLAAKAGDTKAIKSRNASIIDNLVTSGEKGIADYVARTEYLASIATCISDYTVLAARRRYAALAKTRLKT